MLSRSLCRSVAVFMLTFETSVGPLLVNRGRSPGGGFGPTAMVGLQHGWEVLPPPFEPYLDEFLLVEQSVQGNILRPKC